MRTVLAAAAIALGCVLTSFGATPSGNGFGPMSFSNRQLLNRASVYGLERLEVILLADPARMNQAKSAVAAVQGTVSRELPALGYLRVEIPTAHLATLAANPAVDSYQISTNANMLWDQEGQTEDVAMMYRNYEGRPLRIEPDATDHDHQHDNLPVLSPAQAREPGYTAEDDTGVGQWLTDHPLWDGRGVTIAFLESGLPEFGHPTLRTARSLDGQEVPKLAALINTVDQRGEDDTRVSMQTVLHSSTVWHEISGRTYTLPHVGNFRFGIYAVPAGGNLRQEFAVLWDMDTGDIWVDSDGDGSFKNEKPMRDVNERPDIGHFALTYPSKITVAFVVTKSRAADSLHIYTARGGHHAMTSSVAAGGRTPDGVAFGVAPNARIAFVRTEAANSGYAPDFVEGYAEIAGRPDIDVLSDSRGIGPMPDMAGEFYSLVFQRLAKLYHKPVFHSGGNDLPGVALADSTDGVFAVGGSISPATYAALYGGGQLDRQLKHPFMSQGPGGDGGLKPDFLAPMHRLSADKCVKADKVLVPKNAPVAQLPPCYQISCCTSSSGPYAAGVAALLISAARQEGEVVSVDDLGRALRAGAHYLPDTPAYAQGTGILDINAAWKELHKKVNVPQVHFSGPVVQPMAQYAAHPGEGGSIFEVSGWAPGQSGERRLKLRRDSGPAGTVKYRVSWTGNDGTFESPRSVRLPLRESVTLPVSIRVKSFGPHSALLNLHDPGTDAIVVRTLATIIAPQSVARAEGSVLTLKGTVPLMQSREYYFTVPPGAAALRVDLDLKRGALSTRMRSLDPTENNPNRPMAAYFPFQSGRYTWVIPNPSEGTWGMSLTNDTGWREKDLTKVSTVDADYSVSFAIMNGAVRAADEGERLSIHAENHGARLTDPVADVYPAARTLQTAEFLPTGEPNLFPIDVPEGSEVLKLDARADNGGSPLEIYLYDCTSGQCFLWDYAGIAAHEQTVSVHKPKAGKWMAAVNAAPSIVGHGRFSFDELVGGKSTRYPLLAKTHWTTTVDKPAALGVAGKASPVVYCELVDKAVEEAETERLAAMSGPAAPADKKGPAKPVAVASTIYAGPQ
jgi:hypothetical protein